MATYITTEETELVYPDIPFRTNGQPVYKLTVDYRSVPYSARDTLQLVASEQDGDRVVTRKEARNRLTEEPLAIKKETDRLIAFVEREQFIWSGPSVKTDESRPGPIDWGPGPNYKVMRAVDTVVLPNQSGAFDLNKYLQGDFNRMPLDNYSELVTDETGNPYKVSQLPPPDRGFAEFDATIDNLIL